MKHLPSIQEQWLSLAKAAIPTLAPGETQYDEMRRCFFAGALSLFTFVNRLGEPDISEDDGANYLDRIEAELAAFSDTLRTLGNPERN